MTETIDLAQGDVRLLDTDLAKRLLAANLPARLAFTAADGTPRVIPINFWWNGTEVVMTGFATSKKAKMLRARPEVAITIDTNAAPPEVLLIRGRAEISESDGLLPEYAAAMRKGGEAEVAEYLDFLTGMAPRMERIAVRPSWVGLMDFRTRYPEGAPEWMKGPSDAAAHPAHEETI
ncbi:pyridoxamine 5'-phosphate oxidase family protein [Nocardia altamirensis]|uniref:pyridoxamine 5'-phosphate oxidase family protein n=1 Tax=Nocardia altamirensis TaxID=472158 RepID=UPI0008408BE3|nr:pyridoxamine 5'-phosphate oxidase family protein [Nocardia altamirensis]